MTLGVNYPPHIFNFFIISLSVEVYLHLFLILLRLILTRLIIGVVVIKLGLLNNTTFLFYLVGVFSFFL